MFNIMDAAKYMRVVLVLIIRSMRNVVQGRSFAGLLEQVIRKYQNRAIETAQVIEELIQLAKDVKIARDK